MKRIFFSTLVSLLLIPVTQAQYQTERTGYDGDFFSLEGAIELFKNSRSLNDFERKLNSKNSYVNNLDLDYDGRIDYVRVEHRRQGDFHAIILQVPLDRYDVQDVAVIEIEKVGRRDAVLQIIGDPDLYGQEVVVEPYEGSRYTSGREYVSDTYVNVYYWPVVQRMYGPDYVVYVSPYRYNYYPTWWVTWRPFSWNVYYTRIRPYHRHCRSVTIYRTPHVHNFYRHHRRYSTHVAHRTERLRTEHSRSHRAYGTVNHSQNQDRYGSGIKRSDPSREINRNQSPDRYGSGIKRSSPSREINRQRETNRLESNNHERITGDQRPSPNRKSTVTPERNIQRSDRTYRQTPNTRSTERSPSKVTTPRRSGEQIKRNAEPRREAPSVRQRSSNSSSPRSYSKPPARPKTNSIKRSSPSSSKSPRSTVKSNRSTPAKKSSAPSRSSPKH